MSTVNQLHKAVLSGNLEEVKRILAGFPDGDPRAEAVLTQAEVDSLDLGQTQARRTRGVKMEVSAAFAVFQQEELAKYRRGRNAVSLASEMGHKDVAVALLELLAALPDGDRMAADAILAKDGNHQNAFSRASGKGHLDVVVTLLEVLAALPDGDRRAEAVLALDDRERNAVLMASGKGHLDVVVTLLEVLKALPDGDQVVATAVLANEWTGKNALHCASENGHEDVALALLEVLKALPDVAAEAVLAKGPFDRNTVLWAISSGYTDVALALLEVLKALPDGDRRAEAVLAKDRQGYTAISLASDLGHKDVALALLEVLKALPDGDRMVAQAILEPAEADRHAVLLASNNGSWDVALALLEVLKALPDGDQIAAKAILACNCNCDNILTRNAKKNVLQLMVASEGNAALEVFDFLTQRAYLSVSHDEDRGPISKVTSYDGYLGLDPGVLILDGPDKRVSALPFEHARGWWPASRTSSKLEVFGCGMASELTHPDVLSAISMAKNSAVFDAGLCKAIVQFAFGRVRVLYYLDVGCAIVYMALLSGASYAANCGSSAMVRGFVSLLCVLTAKDLLDMFADWRTKFPTVSGGRAGHCKRAIKWAFRAFRKILLQSRASDMVDIVRFGVEAWSLTLLLADGAEVLEPGNSSARAIIALFAFMRWVHLLWEIRAWRFLDVGARMLPILEALRDTLGFLVVLGIFVAGAVHAYYILGARADPTPFYAAFMQMFRLTVLGDFDLFELEGEDVVFDSDGSFLEPRDPTPSELYIYIHALFYIGSFIFVMLMSLLVGVLGSNYDRYEAQSERLYYRELARMSVEYRGRPLYQFLRRMTIPDEDSELVFVSRVQTGDADEGRSSRKQMSDLGRQMADLNRQIAELVKSQRS